MLSKHYLKYVVSVPLMMVGYDSHLNTVVFGQVLPQWDTLEPFYNEGRLGLSDWNGFTAGAYNTPSLPSQVFQGTFDLNLPGRHFWQLGDRPFQYRPPAPEYVMPVHLFWGCVVVQPLPGYRSFISHKGDCKLGGVSLRYHYPIKVVETASDSFWGSSFAQLDRFYNDFYLSESFYLRSGSIQGQINDTILGMSTFNVNGVPNYHGLVIQNDSPVRVSMLLFPTSLWGELVNGIFRILS